MVIAALLRHQRDVRRLGEGHGAGLGQDLVASQGGRVRVPVEDQNPTAAFTTAAEDLETDRRFERSLVTREAAVVAMIAALIVVRQLLS